MFAPKQEKEMSLDEFAEYLDTGKRYSRETIVYIDPMPGLSRYEAQMWANSEARHPHQKEEKY